jgi:hypothetical protein
MKVRDLFAGYRVAISPAGDDWRVYLVSPAGVDRLGTFHTELPEALDVAHEWLLMLVDETELSDDATVAVALLADRLCEHLARRVAGEPVLEASGLDVLVDRDELRRWFEREMNG